MHRGLLDGRGAHDHVSVRSSPVRLLLWLVACGILVHVTWDLAGIGGATAWSVVGDAVNGPIAAAAAWLCVRAGLRALGAERRGWLYVGASCGVWSAGEIAWLAFRLAAGREAPFPSAVHAAYLLSIPLMGAGVLMLGAHETRFVTRVRAVVDGGIIAGSMLFCVWATVLGPEMASTGRPALAQLVAVAFPIGHLVVLSIALFVLHSAGRARAPLGIIALGLAGIGVADTVVAYLAFGGRYSVSSLTDVGSTIGFGLIALAALRSDAPHSERSSRLSEQARAFIPFGGVGATLAAGIYALSQQRIGPMLLTVGVLIFVLQIASQVATTLDNLSLRRGLEAKVAGRTTELREALDKMDEARKLQDQFVAQVSHELRTPLTTLLGASATLGRADVELSPVAESLVEVVSRGAQRMQRMVENLLVVSAMSDSVESMRVPFDLSSELRAAAEQFRPERKHLYVNVPDGLRALGDPERLRVVVRELLQNAAKFAPDFSGVWVNAFPRGEKIEIVVADEGPGVPPQVAERVFDRFFQADSSSTRRNEGAGLGLYIARTIAQSMGGALTLDPGADRGATFRFAIPSWTRAARPDREDHAAALRSPV
jgi:signal transduction histidine kinase